MCGDAKYKKGNNNNSNSTGNTINSGTGTSNIKNGNQ